MDKRIKANVVDSHFEDFRKLAKEMALGIIKGKKILKTLKDAIKEKKTRLMLLQPTPMKKMKTKKKLKIFLI